LSASYGVKTIILRDDCFTKGWPVLSNYTTWSPSAYIFAKDGRTWRDVFQQLKFFIVEILSSKQAESKAFPLLKIGNEFHD
jgi:hypothetical protein